MSSASPEPPRLAVEGLSYGYGAGCCSTTSSSPWRPGEVLCVIGGSGCGKSTLLRVLTGLLPPLTGTVRIDGQDFWAADPDEQAALIRRFGMMYQGGALWTSMTLAENVALPLTLYTGLDARSAARGRRLQAGAGGPRRVRGLPAGGDQRRHGQAGGDRARRWRWIRRSCSSTSRRPASTR